MDSIGGKKENSRATRGYLLKKREKYSLALQTGPQNYHRNLSFSERKRIIGFATGTIWGLLGVTR